MLDKMKRFGPALTAVAFAALTAAAAAMTDGRVDATEGVQIAIQATTIAGVWLVPSVTGWRHTKTAIALLLALENGAVAYIVGGFTGAELVNLAVAAVGVVAVRLTPPPPPALLLSAKAHQTTSP